MHIFKIKIMILILKKVDFRLQNPLKYEWSADMINAAKSYIVEHGLNFNPTKTICKTFGTCTCNFGKLPSCTKTAVIFFGFHQGLHS